MILRDRCGTSYDLASLFRGRRNILETWSRKITKRNEAVSCAHNFPLLKEVSQNCFVFWCCQLQKMRKSCRSAEFWRYQLQKLRTSRRIASFSSLQIADRQIDRWIGNYNYHYITLLLQLQTQINYATLHYTNCTTLHYLHLITLHYTTPITLQLQQQLLTQLQQQYHLHCANYTAVRYNYKYKGKYNYTTLHNTTQHNTTLH